MFNLAVQDLTSNKDVFENTIEAIPQPPLLDNTDSMTDIFDVEKSTFDKKNKNSKLFATPNPLKPSIKSPKEVLNENTAIEEKSKKSQTKSKKPDIKRNTVLFECLYVA